MLTERMLLGINFSLHRALCSYSIHIHKPLFSQSALSIISHINNHTAVDDIDKDGFSSTLKVSGLYFTLYKIIVNESGHIRAT